MSEVNMKAAKALSEALQSANDRELRREAWQWIPIVRKAIDFGRMGRKRWTEIINLGLEENLFCIDGDDRRGKLSPFEEDQVEEEEPQVEEEEPQVEGETKPSPRVHLDCGHWNFQQVPKKKGKKLRTVRVDHPKDCHLCKAGVSGDPLYQRGKYQKPVPKKMRRTPEKQATPSYPGLCSDPETGLYIGGLGNDCRYNPDNGGARCVCHSK